MRYPGLILLMLMLIGPVYPQDKVINVITPAAWPPGTYVPVRIEITLGSSYEFARFYQNLPQGFTVRSGETAGADFYWENNQVNFVWLKMPAEKTIRISYLAKADELLKGSFRLGGTLDYVVDGDRRNTVNYGPMIIKLDENAVVEEGIEDHFVEEEKEDINVPVKDKVENEEIQQKIEFRVQVAISSDQLTKPELEQRIGCPLKYDINMLRTGNMYKYQNGAFPNYALASAYLDELRSKGVKDAFLVAYRGSEQISISLARTLTE